MWVLVLSSVGGVISLIAAITYVGRSIFKQVDSTDRNTSAINDLSTNLKNIIDRLNLVERDVAVLKDRDKR